MKNKHPFLKINDRKIFFLIVLLSTFFRIEMYGQNQIDLDEREKVIMKIQNALSNEDWNESKKELDQALEKYPNDSDINTLAGKYHHLRGNQDKARFHLIKALNIFPRNVDAKQILVNVETESKRYSSAICYINELLEINPYWRGLWRKKIELYRLQGNDIEAHRLHKRISQIYPDDSTWRAHYIYELEMDAATKYKSGNYEEAIELQKALLREDPKDPSRYLALSNSHLQSKNPDLALQTLEQGIVQFPYNLDLKRKKAGILADQKRYDLLLPFLESNRLYPEYDYYLLEAAQNASSEQPHAYYAKVFDRDPGNEEAFNSIFIYSLSNQDYNQALYLLNRHRGVKGDSKGLYIKERQVYRLMGNLSRSNGITKKLIRLYPNDADVRNDYALVMLDEAKQKMDEKSYSKAIPLWLEVIQYGEDGLAEVAKRALLTAYIEAKEYDSAITLLNQLIPNDEDDVDLGLKKSQIYFAQKKYETALKEFEDIIRAQPIEQQHGLLIGYDEMASQIVKDYMQSYQYDQALHVVESWMALDQKNKTALHHAVNLSMATKNDKAPKYALLGNKLYPDDVFFVIKLVELQRNEEDLWENTEELLYQTLKKHRYHPDLVNANSETYEIHSLELIKTGKSAEAIDKLNYALSYAPENKSLKYTKGLAFEKLKQFDSAYYYQSFYEPHVREAVSFYKHLDYLDYRQKKNEIGIYHLRSRFGDNYVISSISTVEYTRFQDKNTFIVRANYAGREAGKGYQVQGAWARDFNAKTRFSVDFAWADRFFPSFMANGSAFRYFEDLYDFEFEAGIGYRRLDTNFSQVALNDPSMYNLVLGATKEWESIRLNFRFNHFLLDSEYLFNATLNGRYYLYSPKTYITAMAGAGTSPDVELINYQLYSKFSHLNTMVGAGVNHLVYKTASVGVLGTWYNYPTGGQKYRNLYNLYLNCNVAF